MNKAVGFSSPGTKRRTKAMGTNTKSQLREGFNSERGLEDLAMKQFYHIFSASNRCLMVSDNLHYRIVHQGGEGKS